MGLGSFFKRKKQPKVEECHIDINMDNCDGCEKCLIACPNNVLVLNEDSISIRDCQVCRSCKVCMTICPNECITIN